MNLIFAAIIFPSTFPGTYYINTFWGWLIIVQSQKHDKTMAVLEKQLLEAQAASRRQETSSLQQALEEAQQSHLEEKDILQQSNQRLQKTITALQDELHANKTQAASRIAELESNVRVLQEKAKDAGRLMSLDLQRDLDRTMRELDTSRLNIKELEDQNRHLQDDVSTRDEDITALQSEIDRLSAIMETQEQELQRLKIQDDFQLEDTLDELAKQVKDYESTHAQLERLKVIFFAVI